MHKLSFALVAVTYLVVGVVWSTNVSTVRGDANCPFCSAVSQTLRQEMEAMDAVAIAKIVKGSETEADAEFEMLSVIRGDKLIHVNQKARMNYFGKAPEGTQFLVMGVDPPDLLWSSPLPVTEKAVEYIKTIVKLPRIPLSESSSTTSIWRAQNQSWLGTHTTSSLRPLTTT